MTPISSVLACAFLIQGPPAPSPSPSKAPETKVAPPAPSPVPLVLKVKGGLQGTAEIQARQVETRVILDRLKADLDVPLLASNIVARHKVDLSMKATSVVGLLLALAPVVLADIEVGGSSDDPVWKAIHLLGYNEKEPERELKQVGFLVAAGTINDDGTVSPPDSEGEDKAETKKLEEEPKDAGKPMLAVVVTDGRVNLKATKQPLVALLNEVAMRAKVPFDIRGELDMSPIDIVLKDLPLRDLPVALGRPGVRLVVRRNLATGDEVVQGILAGETRPSVPTPREK